MTVTETEHLTEVAEADAQGAIKIVYDDIKSTLRVPMVNLVFRVLATYPDYLQLAWRQLKPNLGTVYFETQADSLRSQAVQHVTALGTGPAVDTADIADVVRVFHYVNPKLLLVVAALRAASNGQYPRLEELPASEKRQIPNGIPAGAPTITLIEAEDADEATHATLEDIKATLQLDRLNSDYRALAAWPDYLTSAWQGLKPLVSRPEYLAIQRELRRSADRAAMILPYRVEINPHIMRLCGLSEEDIDGIRATLDVFYGLLPGLIANLAFMATGALGTRAGDSPFPVTLS